MAQRPSDELSLALAALSVADRSATTTATCDAVESLLRPLAALSIQRRRVVAAKPAPCPAGRHCVRFVGKKRGPRWTESPYHRLGCFCAYPVFSSEEND